MSIRENIRQDIETTRLAFCHLVDSIPEEALSLPSDNPAWNVGQVLFHIAIIPRYMIIEVFMLRKQVRPFQLLPRLIPKSLFDWLNARLTRLGAQKMSRQRLKEIYERSCLAAQQALETVPESDFSKSLSYPLWDPLLAGNVTVEYLFGYVKRHFDSHAAQISKAIALHSRQDKESSGYQSS
jgi:hypothetical protein